MTYACTAIALLFAVVCGANDGAALLAAGLKLHSVPPMYGLGLLGVALMVVPLFYSHVVATFAHRLVAFGGPHARTAMAVAVLTALATVTWATLTGRPTSLTLAIVGGLTGAGLGFGLPVSPSAVAAVLALSVVAPVIGAGAAAAICRPLTRRSAPRTLRHAHRLGFGLQCLAYAANDGQKMLAVYTVLAVTLARPVTLGLLGVLWMLGTLYGLRRVGRSLGGRLLAVRPVHAVSAGIGAGASVLAGSAVGAPMSMTQTLTGGLVGAGVTHGRSRVRWHVAWQLALAWQLTLPASLLTAAAVAALTRSLLA